MIRRRKKGPGDGLDLVAAALEGYELPTFSQVVTSALDELADPEVHLGRVAKILSHDPGLSVHFLRLANSAALGLRTSADTLDRAIAILGRNQVESILIGRAVRGAMNGSSGVIEERRFWTTAATRAVVATKLAQVLEPARRSEFFTAALLQDMALPVLADVLDGYEELLAAWYAGTVDDLSHVEMERFGFDHGTAGAFMCESWEFPPNLVEAIRTHHEEPEGEPTPVQLVEGWHEVDEERGPRMLRERGASVDALSGRLDEILDEALAGVDEVARLFL